MLNVIPNDAVMGATITGLDLREPMSDQVFTDVLAALGTYSVLRFPDQHISDFNLRDFSLRFGDIQGGISKTERSTSECPEVGTLSNVKKNGTFIGVPNAGQDWHTDMSYRDMRGFVNVLYGVTIPRRNGKVLGGTEFSSMHAVYRALPEDVKRKLDGATATHDFEKFWEKMRLAHGTRPAMTAEQKALRPPVHHPVTPIHPITGTRTLYCNPGYAIAIDGWDKAESDAMLDYLFAFQLRPEFRYMHTWTENDVLIWDNLGSIHQAIDDYGPDEARLMKRCQVLASKIFTPEFRQYLPRAA
jgi:taurine dioxygenase